jgi:hypothetical protein
VGIHAVPINKPQRSETGNLGSLLLRRPGLATPVASVTARLTDAAIDLHYVAAASDLAGPGKWTCLLTNETESTITFNVDVIYVQNPHDTTSQEPVGNIMGFHNSVNLPVYDMLAREFAISDRWFASLPTDTWPNRLYSLTGGSGGILDTPSGSDVVSKPLGSVPDLTFSMKTIFEVLQENNVDWNLFFSDLPFSLIFPTLVQDSQYTSRMRSLDELIRRAETGDLPAVSWIDPNFTDVPDGALAANDDHPPGDVTRGQQLVAQVYNALSQGPAWSKTLLLITYDEHGGFYDHVLPPGTAPGSSPPAAGGPADDIPNLRRYGVRVPAFVISPWVPKGFVSKDIYDHTSLLSTILRRFCLSPVLLQPVGPGPGGGPKPGSRVPSMGARTEAANDVGSVLSEASPRSTAPEAGQLGGQSGGPIPVLSPDAFGAVLRQALLGF